MKAIIALALLSPILLANTLVSPGPHGAIAGSKLSAAA